MSELINIARPYARAVFEYALAHQQLQPWSKRLELLANIIRQPNFKKLIKNPKLTAMQLAEIILSILEEQKLLDKESSNFIKLLAENRRLMALPEIAQLFAEFKEESERVINAQVWSVVALDQQTQEKISEMLQTKIGRQVKLHCDTDPNLLGGLLIRAGDLVIDGSVRSQLQRMRFSLCN